MALPQREELSMHPQNRRLLRTSYLSFLLYHLEPASFLNPNPWVLTLNILTRPSAATMTSTSATDLNPNPWVLTLNLLTWPPAATMTSTSATVLAGLRYRVDKVVGSKPRFTTIVSLLPSAVLLLAEASWAKGIPGIGKRQS